MRAAHGLPLDAAASMQGAASCGASSNAGLRLATARLYVAFAQAQTHAPGVGRGSFRKQQSRVDARWRVVSRRVRSGSDHVGSVSTSEPRVAMSTRLGIGTAGQDVGEGSLDVGA